MLERLQTLVRQYGDDPDIVITPDTKLRADLGLNSYEQVQLVCAVEDEFGVEIPDRAISKLQTVQDVLEYITTHA